MERFLLLLLFVGFVLPGNRIVLLELEFVGVLLLILSSVVDMTLAGTSFFVSR